VDRLIGGAPSSQGLLTRKVREQPFMVVLLDEFEKAHPRLFDLLLQVLGEGRLTDAGGRVADFRNCIVILTSNLGAEGFQAAKFGFAESQLARDACEYFTQQAREFLRPEMFNRIDRIVSFQPLEPATIADIAQRELVKVRQRDGIRFRDVSLDVEEAVIESLAAEGYHPKYGARPLKRLIERRLVAPLAQQANEYIAETPLEVKIRSDCQRINVNVRAQDVQRSELAAKQRTLSGIANLSALRRQVHRLEQSQTMLRLRNEAYRLT
jgi:ATP-dependent Clp protease ATP-binding subunit ClpA